MTKKPKIDLFFHFNLTAKGVLVEPFQSNSPLVYHYMVKYL
jgi:hypothetical protein